MATYDSSIALAKRLITKRGESVLLIRQPDPLANPAKPWKPGTSGDLPLVKTVRAVFLDFPDLTRTPLRHSDGTDVRAEDKQVFIAPGAVSEPPNILEDLETLMNVTFPDIFGNGANIQELVQADFDPDLSHKIVRTDGTEWLVRTRKTLNPNGRKILYELWVAR